MSSTASNHLTSLFIMSCYAKRRSTSSSTMCAIICKFFSLPHQNDAKLWCKQGQALCGHADRFWFPCSHTRKHDIGSLHASLLLAMLDITHSIIQRRKNLEDHPFRNEAFDWMKRSSQERSAEMGGMCCRVMRCISVKFARSSSGKMMPVKRDTHG